MNPKYPVYIISKGRWELRLTSKALEKMQVPYHIVIEPQEFEKYAAVIDPKKILVLPFSNLGQGSIPARNWVWEHAITTGAKRHWILDDNIRSFERMYKNRVYRVTTGTIFKVAEDFIDRYLNVPLAGFRYEMFSSARAKLPEFLLNTRIYSCILIDNSCKHRWRGRYNEDTDLSLRVLKDGDCTILFQAFICEKMSTTKKMKGGNQESLYIQNDKMDGHLLMAQSLKKQHPKLVQIKWKFGRWHHQVDYRPFKKNKLIKRPGLIVSKGINEHGMKLQIDDN